MKNKHVKELNSRIKHFEITLAKYLENIIEFEEKEKERLELILWILDKKAEK